MRIDTSRILCFLAALIVSATPVSAQTTVRPGFNLFTPQQDIEAGQQAAAQVEAKITIVTRPRVTSYVSELGAKLARYAPGFKYPYQFKVANLSDVNAFALPGGFIYVHRGLIERVRTEGELAGVMAHEIAHVALRHPTNRVSQAYLANAGIGILGGLLGSRSSSNIVRAAGGFGLNSLMLKNSRSAEEQADIVGAQIMARAGYDPMEMATFFDMLQRESGSSSRVSTFFSDHPAPANRAARIRREAALIGAVHRSRSVGDIELAHADLKRLPAAPTRAQVAQGSSGGTQPASSPTATAPIRPSSRYRIFRQETGFFTIRYPDNWRAYPSQSGVGATFAPDDGIVQTSSGERRLECAVLVNHYVPFEGTIGDRYRDPLGSLFGGTSLEEATSDLVRHIMSANSYLTPVSGTERVRTISGGRTMSLDMVGTPPNGREERVRVFSRELPDEHVVYLLALAPTRDFEALQATFDRMVGSLEVNEQTTH